MLNMPAELVKLTIDKFFTNEDVKINACKIKTNLDEFVINKEDYENTVKLDYIKDSNILTLNCPDKLYTLAFTDIQIEFYKE